MSIELPDSSWAAGLPRERIAPALAHLTALQGALTARLLVDAGSGEPAAPEWNLSIEQMIAMTGKTRRWLFAHRDLPFVRSISRKTIVGDETLLKRWVAEQRRP